MSGGGAVDVGWRGVATPLRSTVRRLRNRLRSASAILLYHRVAEGLTDPWRLCVRPRRFAEHMEVLRRRDLVVDLETLAAAMDEGPRRRAVAVTFDDGYADFAIDALAVLERFEVPASLFVVSGGLDATGEFWWDDLERIVLLPPVLPETLELEIGGRWQAWSVGANGERPALYAALHGLLGRLPDAERARVLGVLRRWAGTPDAGRSTHRRLTSAALGAVAAHGLVRVGAHTVSHPYLSSLTPREQRREIEESKQRLETLTGAPVTCFSYPHGDFGVETPGLVRAAGFRVACTSACEPVFPGGDPFSLPRVEVADLDGEAFARWLDEWVG